MSLIEKLIQELQPEMQKYKMVAYSQNGVFGTLGMLFIEHCSEHFYYFSACFSKCTGENLIALDYFASTDNATHFNRLARDEAILQSSDRIDNQN